MNAVVLRKIFGLYFAFLIFLGRLRAQRDAILTAAGRVQGPDASLSEERQCSVACGRVPVRSRVHYQGSHANSKLISVLFLFQSHPD